MSKEFSRSAIIRRMILENPEITLDEIRSQYEGEGTVPNKMHVLYQEKTNIRTKLGIEDLTTLPQHNNRFNISGFLRNFCTGMEYDEARRFCEYFGLEVSHALYKTALGTSARKKDVSEVEVEVEVESPDPNQNAGPRTRKKGTPGRKKAATKSAPSVGNGTYESIETSLDELIQQASSLSDSTLTDYLKNARRQVGASILKSN